MLTALLAQTATLWSATGTNAFDNSALTYGPPTIIKSRWEQMSELSVDFEASADINTESFSTRIYVDRDIEIEDYIALGEHIGEPQTNEEAHKVKEFSKLSDIRLLRTTRIAYI